MCFGRGLGAVGAGQVAVNHIEGTWLCALSGGWLVLCGAMRGYLLPRVYWCTPWAELGAVGTVLAALFAVRGVLACTLDAGRHPSGLAGW